MSSLRTSNVRVVSLDSLAETAANGASEKLWEMADDDPNIDPDSVAEETMVAHETGARRRAASGPREDDRPPLLHEVPVAEEHRRSARHLRVARVAATAPRDPAAADGADAGAAGSGMTSERMDAQPRPSQASDGDDDGRRRRRMLRLMPGRARCAAATGPMSGSCTPATTCSASWLILNWTPFASHHRCAIWGRW